MSESKVNPKRENTSWEYLAPDGRLCEALAGQARISPFLASLLVNRGVSDAAQCRRFLDPGPADLADPLDLPDMDRASSRLALAVERGEKILVCGDYDADGITATALLTLFLRNLGAEVRPYLPDRLEEGYGLHLEPLRAAAEAGYSLAVSVDCGTGSPETASRAAPLGIDLVITDHHRPDPGSAPMPPEVPLVNPRLGSDPETLSLSGVGVAFMLARAVAARTGGPDDESLAREYLDLVAVGTIADRSPQVGQSRVMTVLGLEELRNNPRPGFRELLALAGNRQVDDRAVAFDIAPRLNAAGRMNHALPALELLLSGDPGEVAGKAAELERNNRERQRFTRKIMAEAREIIERDGLERGAAIVVAGPGWKDGLLGIIAGRVSDLYGKPAVIIGGRGEFLRGSGRSARGIDLHSAATACASLLDDYGGHEPAIGFTIRRENVDHFRERLEKAVAEQETAGQQPPACRVDCAVSLTEVNRAMIRDIARLAPFGPENEEPVLASRRLQVQKFSRRFGRGEEHLRLWLKDGALYREGIGFNMGELKDRFGAGTMVDAAYTPRISSFRGLERLELDIKFLREHEETRPDGA